MDAVVFPKEKALTSKEFYLIWCKEHQDRLIRQLLLCSFGKNVAYILFHFDKKESKTKEEKEGRKGIEEERGKKKKKKEKRK